jgi:hypothetical protein
MIGKMSSCNVLLCPFVNIEVYASLMFRNNVNVEDERSDVMKNAVADGETVSRDEYQRLYY